MASWKKVIVSGSSAILNQVTASGGFSGDGSGLTGIAADSLGNNLQDGNGIVNFTFDGSANKTVTVELDGGTLAVGASGVKIATGGVTATQLHGSVAGNGLAGGGGTALSVGVDGSSIEINSDALRVKASGITNTMLSGSIANAKLANDGITIAGVDTSLGGTITAATIGTAMGAFSGSAQVTGITVGQMASNSVDTAQIAAGAVETAKIDNNAVTNAKLQHDGITIAGVDTSLGDSISSAEILLGSAVISGSGGVVAALTAGEGIDIASNGTVSGEDATTTNKGIAKFNTANFAVTSGDVTIKNGGVANVELVHDGITIAGVDTSLGGTITQATILAGSTAISGSGGVAAALTAGEGIDIASNGTVSGENATTTNKGIASFDTNHFTLSSGAVTIKAASIQTGDVANDAITGDKLADNITIAGNLTVNGATTTLSTANLSIEDKFITIASGSTSATDGGIIVSKQANGAGFGFGYDTATTRWVFDNDLAVAATGIVADAFVSVTTGSTSAPSAAPSYGGTGNGYGTMHVKTNTGDIYIYA